MAKGIFGDLFDFNFDGKLDPAERGMEMEFLDYSHKKYGDYNIHDEKLFEDIDDMLRGVNPEDGHEDDDDPDDDDFDDDDFDDDSDEFSDDGFDGDEW